MSRHLTSSTTSSLPPLYAGWMDQLLAGPIPEETEATCQDCVMVARECDPMSRSTYCFNPNTKCCTFLPELPNFLVGRILADNDSQSAPGRATVEARLRAGIAVTPLGLGRSAPYDVLYRNSVLAFGRSQTLRCPHYLEEGGGRCGIWRHREAVCTTWFCKHVRGAVGLHLWQTLRRLLAAVETSLARWCVLELDIGSEALQSLFPVQAQAERTQELDREQLDTIVNSEVQQALWGTWSGQEREFFQACAHLVNPLTWREVSAIGGPEMRIFARLTREAYKQLMSDEMPAQLRVGPFTTVHMRPDVRCVSSYSDYDPLDLSTALMHILHYFDGRPTAEVLQDIAVKEGKRVDAALVRRLVDFRILVPGDKPMRKA